MRTARELVLGAFSALFAAGAVVCCVLAVVLRMDQPDKGWNCSKGASAGRYTEEGVYQCIDKGSLFHTHYEAA